MAGIQYLVDEPTSLPIVDKDMLSNELVAKYKSICEVYSNNDVTIYYFGKGFGGAAVKVTGVSEVKMVFVYRATNRFDKIKKTLESILGKNLVKGRPVR